VGVWAAIGASVFTFVLGSVSGWAIEESLDSAFERATRPPDLAVSTSFVSLDGWVVANEDFTRAQDGLADVSYGNWDSYMSGYSRVLTMTMDVWGRKDGGPIVLEGLNAIDTTCIQIDDAVRLPTPGFGADFPIRKAEVTVSPDTNSQVVPLAGETWTYPLQVSEVEAERFLLRFDAPRNLACTFRLEWDLTVSGESETQVFPATGEDKLRVAGQFNAGKDVLLESFTPSPSG
jgi:hypothetical protein